MPTVPYVKEKENTCHRSNAVRELLEEYVKTRDIDSYFENLWERIGGKLASSGFGPRDVERVIRDVRNKH